MQKDEAESKGAKILVVDDNQANCLLAQSTLEDEGYRVFVAHDGEQGLAAFQRERPECVLLDVRMPGLDGFAVCERIRALPGGKEAPIVYLTALRDVETFDRALACGADDFLTKPVRPAELVARVQASLKLRQMRAELQEHYWLLKQQRDDLMRVQLQKERLAAFVVHDLKNPVNSVALHAQVLLRSKDLPPSLRDSVTHIHNETRQLSRMILNLLDVSKADEGKLSLVRVQVELAPLVDELFAEIELSAKTRNIGLRRALAIASVHVDRDLFRRALSNVLENAVRHAPVDSLVTVSASAAADAVELRIADQGKGVPSELRERIFEPYVQLDAGDPQLSRGGRGLGLSFCKLVVVAHGGRIWVEDAEPGAVFCMRFPSGA